MSRTPERSTVIRLSETEYAQVERLAREREMQPEYFMTDLVRLGIMERRDETNPLVRAELELARARTKIVELTRAILHSQNGTRQ